MADAPNTGTIGNLTTSQLTRYIRDIFQRYPPTFFPSLTVDALTVVDMLTVADQADFQLDIHSIGATGQPAFAGTWVNSTAPLLAAAYYKDVFGFVHLVGSIKSGTINTTAFTLPPGFRPRGDMNFACSAAGAFGTLKVSAGGVVTPVAGATTEFSLNGAYFLAA